MPATMRYNTSKHLASISAKWLGGRRLASTTTTLLILVVVIALPTTRASVGFGLDSGVTSSSLSPEATLAYSTYLGGSADDRGASTAVDPAGNIYLVGSTNSVNFAITNAYQPTLNGERDAYVVKIDPTGTTLIYATYLGGSGVDEGYGIVVDASGNAYVTGQTTSTDFPLQNAFQSTLGDGYDAFVTKLSPTGTTLIYSTYLGGSSTYIGGIASEIGLDIEVDTSGSAYITGQTTSTDFPLQDAFQSAFGGGATDAFVTKLSPTGSTLIYSTYLGGSSDEGTAAIAVDTSGNTSVTGETWSTNFPLESPFQSTRGGPRDAFVTKFSPTGSTLIYSTYLGGSSIDEGSGIAVDASGNVYITGFTESINFPLQNPFQSTRGSISDAFVTKFSPAGSTLIYSTYLGGNSNDLASNIAVDLAGNAYVTGATLSTNFPLRNPFQSFWAGDWDVFVTGFTATGSTLLYSTYLGGSRDDFPGDIAVATQGNAYIIGNTISTNFPLEDPFQPVYGGGRDAFVSKISDQQGTPTPSPIPPSPSSTNTAVLPTSTVAPPTATQASTNTPTTQPPTSTPIPPTITSTATREPCTLTFSDVPEGSTFYTNIRCLACRGIISGYADGTFRPNNEVTRGQLAKIVSNAAGFSEDPNPQIFEDAPASNTFYQWINRLARRGHMSGYTCGGVGEPCTSGMPYFRPFANATRGQTSKIVSNAAGYTEIPTDQTFEDVPPTHTFYNEIQRLASRNIMQGYPCGGPGEPCVSGRPYFRPQNNVTRGQSAKIVANTFFPGCVTP
jgi:hypothetical protein